MSAPTIGLQTAIWNNNLKSIALLALYPVFIALMVWVVASIIGMGTYGIGGDKFAWQILQQYWPIIITVVTIWFMIAYFFHTSMIRALSHSHSVERKDEPELYNLLENLCIAAGMKMPRLEIIETHARNAFASGIDDKSYSVTVTRGLMNALTKDELEGVLAHELTHIMNRDVRLLMVTVIFTGMIGFAAQMAWSQVRYNLIYAGRRRDNGGAALIIIMIAGSLWIGYIASLFMRFALSRRREYMADAGAIKLTKNPEAMMRALMRISGKSAIPQAPGDIDMMCIENARPFMGLFATHPPIEKRIRALAEMTGAPIPQLSLPPAPPEERFQPERKEFQNPWLARTRGQRVRQNPWSSGSER